MRAAADDIAAGGRVADLFASVPNPSGSLPALRLLAALHHLVLAGRAPELAAFYPSAGGTRAPADAWPAAVARSRSGRRHAHPMGVTSARSRNPAQARHAYPTYARR